MPSTHPIGFVGLGAMGGPLAAALLDAGVRLAVFDVRPEAGEALVARGATRCASVMDVAAAAATVFVSLPGPELVRDVACGDSGLVHGATIDTFVDLSTTGAAVAAEVAGVLQKRGIAYLDAPVSGGVAGAEARSVTVMASGAHDVFERVRPLLEAFAGAIFWVGSEPGLGQIAKLLNNLLSATAVAITSEAMTLGVGAGLDPEALLEIFNASSGRNTATSDKFPKHVLTRRFGAGFRLGLMAKDVELCLGEARLRHVPMLVGGVVQQLWTLAASQIGDTADHTEFVRLYEDWSGIRITAREEGR